MFCTNTHFNNGKACIGCPRPFSSVIGGCSERRVSTTQTLAVRPVSDSFQLMMRCHGKAEAEWSKRLHDADTSSATAVGRKTCMENASGQTDRLQTDTPAGAGCGGYSPITVTCRHFANGSTSSPTEQTAQRGKERLRRTDRQTSCNQRDQQH